MIQIFGMEKNKLDNYEIRKVSSQITGSKHNFFYQTLISDVLTKLIFLNKNKMSKLQKNGFTYK